MQIGNNNCIINQEYYIAGDVGENIANYPRLSSFSDAFIDNKTGLSTRYPGYHFEFKLIQYNNFDSGLSSIYRLVIRRIT